MYVETDDPEVPERASSDCSGTRCIFSVAGYRVSVDLADLGFVSINAQAIGSKHDITLVSGKDSDFKVFGAWMDHSYFSTQSQTETISDGNVSVTVVSRYGSAAGDLTGSMPSGSVMWQGVMVGMPVTGNGKGNLLQADALLEYDMGASNLDATFSNIRNIDHLVPHSTRTIRFDDVSVSSGGTFRAGLTGNRIQGGFYGPNHIEAAGVFEQSNIAGAFGVKRQ